MGHRLRSDRRGLRRAIAASVVLHILVALAAFLALRFSPRTGQPVAVVNTRADAIGVKVLAEIESAPVPVPIAVEPPKSQPSVEPPSPPHAAPEPAPRQEPAPVPVRTPHATAVPHALPRDVLKLIHKPTPTTQRPTSAAADANVKPAAAVGTRATVPPIHGALRRDQSIVYVLDCSGSMGEFGKLTLARAALIATLRGQPGEVRFQVIAYGTTARTILTGGCAPASKETITAAESGLATLAASGKSNHIEAVRRAALLRPDVIVLLTDSNELTTAAIKPLLGAAGKPIVVCVAQVTGDGVGTPRELN